MALTYNSEQTSFLNKCIDEVKQALDATLTHYHPRDDYLEMLRLCQCVLGICQETKRGFRRPSAMHKARWMSKIIYSIKMCHLSEQMGLLPKETVGTKHQLNQLKEFVMFISCVYARWSLKLFKCPLA